VKRARVIFLLALVAGSLAWVATKALSGNLVYYKTPTEVLREGSTLVGQHFRLGGLGIPGSVERSGSLTRFVITDGTTRLTVIDVGSLPALFRDGQGVVVEGLYQRDGAFHSDTVLVKHNGVYSPPSPGETPTSADLAGNG